MDRSLTCIDCAESEIFATEEDLEAHIASRHLDLCPYECEKCKFAKFPTEYALIFHCVHDHGMDSFTVKYHYTAELHMKKRELAQKLKTCIRMCEPIQLEVKPNDAVSSTVENRVKSESTEPISSPIQSSSPRNFADNANLHSYRAFLDETLTRHEEERVGPSHASVPEGRIGPMKSKQQIQCSLCPEKVSKQRSSMVYHANTRHGKLELYECGYCHRKWQTIAKSDVIKHIKSHHELPDGTVNNDMVIDYRKNLGTKLREITDKCFPEKKKKRIGYSDAME